MTAVFGVLAGRLYQLQIENGEALSRPGRGQPHQSAAAGAFARPHPGPLRRRACRQSPQLSRPDRARADRWAGWRRPSTRSPTSFRSMRGRGRKSSRMHAANRSFVPLVVAENLSWEEFARLNLDLPYLPGVQPEVGDTRDYPYTEELSHVLGYVAPVSPDEKVAMAETRRSAIRCPTCPASGSASAASNGPTRRRSAAVPGRSRVEVNAYGRVIRELDRDHGDTGNGCSPHDRPRAASA